MEVRLLECLLGDVGFARLRRIPRFLLQKTAIYEDILGNAEEHQETIVIAGCRKSYRNGRGYVCKPSKPEEVRFPECLLGDVGFARLRRIPRSV